MCNKIICLSLIVLAGLLACENTAIKKLSVIDLTVKNRTIKTEVARTMTEKATGLMYRKTLGADEGMLFVYDREERLSFYMKNTLIPLSIAFISADGVILQIEDMRPLDESTVESHFSVRYALEVNQGVFDRWGIVPGDRVVFSEGYKK